MKRKFRAFLNKHGWKVLLSTIAFLVVGVIAVAILAIVQQWQIWEALTSQTAIFWYFVIAIVIWFGIILYVRYKRLKVMKGNGHDN